MNRRVLMVTIVSLIITLGIAGYALMKFWQPNALQDVKEGHLLNNKHFQIEGSIYGPEEKLFLRPLAVAANQDRIYVADSGNNRVVVYSRNGKLLQTLGEKGSSAEKLLLPTDIVVSSTGKVFVADRQAGRVMVYNSAGALVDTLPKGTDRIKLQGFSPLSLALGPGDELYAFDVYHQRVVVFDQKARFSRTLEPGNLNNISFANGILVIGQEDILLTNGNEGKVVGFKPKEQQVYEYPGLPETAMFMPRGITPAGEGQVWITDAMQHGLIKYDLKQKQVVETVGYGGEEKFFSYPNDIATFEDLIFVADKEHNRIVILQQKE